MTATVIADSEQELIRRAKAGDLMAYEELLRPHLASAARLSRALIGRPADAEDAVQEAAIRAWRRIGNLKAGFPFQPWFLGIVVRQARSIQRSGWWRVVALPNLQMRPGTEHEAWLEGEDLRRAVASLPRSEREAILLHFYLDLRIKDVASTLQVSDSAVKARINRGLRRLRSSPSTLAVLMP